MAEGVRVGEVSGGGPVRRDEAAVYYVHPGNRWIVERLLEPRGITGPMDNNAEETASLEDRTVAKVREWFARSAGRMSKSVYDVPELKVRLTYEWHEEDGTLVLCTHFDETLTHDDDQGEVPGVKVDR